MKPTLLILHGAIGAASQLKAIASKAASTCDVHLFNFPGHGGTTFPDSPFSIALFADATLQFIREKQLDNITVFGYSMGGYVALYLARQYPGLFRRIITLGTKFHWDEAVATKEIKMMDPGVILNKVPAFAETLAALHAPNDWKEVLIRTAAMLNEMGQNNPLKEYSDIETPALIMLGDRDKMVTLDETVTVYKSLPNAQMVVLPNTAHPIDQVNTALLSYFIHLYSFTHL